MKTSRNKKADRGTQQSRDWWDETGIKEHASIDRGLAELKAGKGIAHEEVRKQYAGWFIR